MTDAPVIALSGNLTRDPELRYTSSGVAVASFSLAYTPRRRNDEGTYVDGTTLFVRINAWRHLAEHVAESLTKGNRVTVRGVLEQREWQDDKGERRTALEVTATDVAASLQYATVSVRKAARSGADDTPPPADPWSGEVATESARPVGTP